MTGNVIRFCDFDKRSRQPDAAQPRDPFDADVIAFPIVRFPRADQVQVGPPLCVAANARD